MRYYKTIENGVITMIGSGGYGNNFGTFRCVYIGKIE